MNGESNVDANVAMLRVAFHDGETTRAVEGLLAVNRPDEACMLLAEITYRQLDQIDVDEMAALLSAIPDAVIARHPRCLIKLARAAEGRVRIELRTRRIGGVPRYSSPIPRLGAVISQPPVRG